VRRALRVYFSATTARALELLALAEELEDDGLVISSSWLHHVGSSTAVDPRTPDAGRTADQDLHDLRASDVCLVFAEPTGAASGGRGGRHVELGIAIELGLHIIVLGEPEHIFHALPSIWVSHDWCEVRQRLRKLARREADAETLEGERGKTPFG
jgi:hypothetical protein